MPILSRRLDETTLLVIPAKVGRIHFRRLRLLAYDQTIMFQYNVQHDCRQAKCVGSGKRAVVQERVQTELSEPNSFIEHNPLDRFLINTHAFHNAHLIRAVLPRDLIIPIAYSADRIAHHTSVATKLREIQDGKRQNAAEKKRAAAELRKAAEVEGDEAGGTGRKRRRGDAVTRENAGS
jgi:hypothetical protein